MQSVMVTKRYGLNTKRFGFSNENFDERVQLRFEKPTERKRNQRKMNRSTLNR